MRARCKIPFLGDDADPRWVQLVAKRRLMMTRVWEYLFNRHLQMMLRMYVCMYVRT